MVKHHRKLTSLTLLLLLFCRGPVFAQQPGRNTWQQNPLLLSRLGAPITLDEYSFQIPSGWLATPLPFGLKAPPGSDIQYFAAEQRSDGTRPTLGFIFFTPPPGTETAITLDQWMSKALTGESHHLPNFYHNPPIVGYINGIQFERSYFKGTLQTASGQQLAHGFVYVAIEGAHYIELRGEDVEPYNQDTLPVAEEAVFTFQAQAQTHQ